MRFQVTDAKRTIVSIALSASLLFTTACTVDQTLSDVDLVLQTAAATCAIMGPVLPSDVAACESVTGVGIAAVNAFKSVYDSYESGKGTTTLQDVQAALNAITQNLQQALAAAHIVDAHAVQVITDWVKFVVGVVQAIVNQIPNLMKASNGSTVKVALVLPKPEDLKAQWISQVCRGNSTWGNLVTVHHVHTGFGSGLLHAVGRK